MQKGFFAMAISLTDASAIRPTLALSGPHFYSIATFFFLCTFNVARVTLLVASRQLSFSFNTLTTNNLINVKINLFLLNNSTFWLN
jgi:hypothetical protein